MTYKTKIVEREFQSDGAQENIKSKRDFKSKKDALKKELTENITDLEGEKEYIMECASRFGSFLKQNALVPYNDAFEEYIDMLIYDEEHKTDKVINWDQIKKLKNDKEVYEEKKRVLDDSLKTSPKDDIKNEAILVMRDELVKLKYNGRPLKHALSKTY